MFQVMAIKIAAGYCALTYVLVMVLFVFYWCHPTVEYWAVPVRIGKNMDSCLYKRYTDSI